MLGIGIAKKENSNMDGTEAITQNPYVFLFFTEAGQQKVISPMANRVYKYELIDNNTRLVNPTLLIELPSLPDDSHVGGVLGLDLIRMYTLLLVTKDQLHLID